MGLTKQGNSNRRINDYHKNRREKMKKEKKGKIKNQLRSGKIKEGWNGEVENKNWKKRELEEKYRKNMDGRKKKEV
jgi:hypothetical protein